MSTSSSSCARHVQLVEGRAKAAQVYPKGLCRAVITGIVEQARLNSKDEFCFDCNLFEDCVEELIQLAHDEDNDRGYQYWDDTSGEVLDPKLTREARMEEIAEIRNMTVYRKVPVSMCLKETGKRPVGTRWVDTNKGDQQSPNIRSRLVAQEINKHKMPELFAATPPLEFIKFLISLCASAQWSASPTRLMVCDVKKAYFYAKATRRVFVALPAEDQTESEKDMCGLLERSLYGTRDAAYNWTETYTNVLVEKMGFSKGESSPCSFYHERRRLTQCRCARGRLLLRGLGEGVEEVGRRAPGALQAEDGDAGPGCQERRGEGD